MSTLGLYDRAIVMAPNDAVCPSTKAGALIGLGRLPVAVMECELEARFSSSSGVPRRRCLIGIVGDASPRFLFLPSVVHFLKKVLKVLFVHKYSGAMGVESTVIISASYFLYSVISIYSQYLAGVSGPSIDMKYAGFILFLIGILGNFYHHLVLSKLRTKDGEGYKIPRGGLNLSFAHIICLR